MKQFLTIAIGLFILCSAYSQDKTDAMLFGHVTIKGTNEHIPYVSLVVKGTKMGTTSDRTGHFKMVHLPVGKNTIIAHSLGYKTVEVEVIMERNKTTELQIELEEDVLNLEQVVVTGTKTKHYVKDVPVRTEVITARALESKNAINLFQALEGTPGIRVENQCQYCNFTMIRMQGLGAEHTQVLIDGQPMYSGLAGVYGLQQLSTIDISSIEVVKGAGSALYGSGAVAGAINIISKSPSWDPSTIVDIQMGSYGTNKYDISSSLRNGKGDIGLNIFAQRYTEDAIDQTGPGATQKEVKKKDGISDRVATNLTNAGFSLYIDNALFRDDKLVLRGKSIFEKREGGTMTDDYYKNPLTDGTESITTDRYEASLMYTKPFGHSSGLNISAAYVNHNRNATNDSYLGDYMSTHNDNVPDLRNMRPYLADENSFNAALSFNKNTGSHNVIVGVQAFHDKLEESGMYVVVDEDSEFLGQSYRSVATKSAAEFGVFIQDEWAITSKLMVVPGIRFDMHESNEEYTSSQQVFTSANFPKTSFSENAFNPRIAIKYKVSEHVTLRANAGTGFRAPYGFSEDLHLCSGSPRVWKSSELKPETSISYNLSADYYGNWMRISTNLFRTDLKNKIGFTDADAKVSALGYDYQWKNIDDAFVQGVELSIISNISNQLDAGIDFTFNQGEYKNSREDWVGTLYEKDSKYIPRFAQTTGNVKIEYRPKNWIITAAGSFYGSMYIDYMAEENPSLAKIKKTDPFMLFNARVSRQIGWVKLYAGANNIFGYVQDEKYLDDAAFMYAPVYGAMFYAGIAIQITH